MPLENDGSQSVDQSAAESMDGAGASSESLVTPQIEAKFAEVFGNGDSGAGEASARQRQADAEQQEELDEAAQAADAGSAAGDDTDGSAKQADDPTQKADPKAKAAAPASGEDNRRKDRLIGAKGNPSVPVDPAAPPTPTSS